MINPKEYTEVNFGFHTNEPNSEILIALLSVEGYEGFLENEKSLTAYIPSKLFDENMLEMLLSQFFTGNSISYSIKTILEKNWNTAWENNFKPVLIENKVYIRAPFHIQNREAELDIIIEPKMSFGTGHHETTSLMVSMILDIDHSGKTVLDAGCGTGILSILAEKKGASVITAIDNDKWAYENTHENLLKNNCKRISVSHKELSGLGIFSGKYDIVYANINRNAIENNLGFFYEVLKNTGILLLSGFYNDDLDIILAKITKLGLGLVPDKKQSQNSWIACKLIKNVRD
ncbi:MAG: 50S ribosomal protein L11 methyltransferase [Bacteroidales bacterium]|nr:50S ribosomal protein L11 methyltransferase [Bacteroidales bacterium]